MSAGFVRLRIASVNFLQGFAVPTNDFVIRLELNKQVIDIHHLEDAGFIYFETPGQALIVTLADPHGQSTEIGQAEVRLFDLLKYPESLQKITVYLAVRDKAKGWLERDAAIITLEFLYSTDPFKGRLQLTVVNADLTRNTEIVGEMDPYVVIRHLGQEHRSKTLKNKGKHPDWNERFLLPINSVNDTIELRVMDQDVMKDDEVGRVVLNIREAGFLSMTPPIIRTFELLYKQKPAGVIRLEGHIAPP